MHTLGKENAIPIQSFKKNKYTKTKKMFTRTFRGEDPNNNSLLHIQLITSHPITASHYLTHSLSLAVPSPFPNLTKEGDSETEHPHKATAVKDQQSRKEL